MRDYGKYDRREAPQYYADAEGGSNTVAVSLPSIGRSLGASFADVQWATGYVLIVIREHETAPMRAAAPAKIAV